MEKRISYMNVLLKNGLNIKKNNSLFISIPNKHKYMAIELEYIARSFGVEDIFIFYNDISCQNKMAEYIDKGAKFLFFTSEDNESLNMQIINDIINNDLGIDYTVAILPTHESITDKDLYKYSSINSEDAVMDWNKMISSNSKMVSQIRNFKLNMLKVESLNDTNITMKLTGNILGNSETKKMRLFPNYKIEIVPVEGTANGYVNATMPVMINNVVVEELRLFLRNGHVVDYDCSTGAKEASVFFNPYFNPMLDSVGLIDKEAPTYDKYTTFNNIVLDRTSKPYILVSSYDEEKDEKQQLFIPIASKCLKVVGYNEDGKNMSIYEDEGFSKKITLKKNK